MDISNINKVNSTEISTRGVLNINNVNYNKKSNNNNEQDNNNNFEEERFMVDERLTENDFIVKETNEKNTKNDDNESNNNQGIINSNINSNNENSKNINDNLDDSYDSYIEDIKKMNSDQLKVFVKKTKKESKEFYKKALDMLTENEFEIMKLKSENEQLKDLYLNTNTNNNNNNNVENYFTENLNLNNNRHERNYIISQISTNVIANRKKSYCSDLINESTDINNLFEELENLKKENTDKQEELESNNKIFNEKITQLEIDHKLTCCDYENEIYKLKLEVENLEVEKNILEKDINKDNNERYNLAENLEEYKQIIRNLEEQKDKSDRNGIILNENLKSENKKMQKIILDNSENIQKLEKEIKSLKYNEDKALKDLSDDFKRQKYILETEAIELHQNNRVLSRERDLLKRELDCAKEKFKSIKLQISDLSIDNTKIKESKDEEMKKIISKYEESIEELNNKFHQEKINLREQINELLTIIEEKGMDNKENESLVLQNLEMRSNRNSIKISEITKANSLNVNFSNINNDNNLKEGTDNLINNFNFETLNKEIENLKSKNFKLQVEITSLNNKLKVKENKIANTIRLKSEIDTLKKDKSKYKSDMLELKKLYEEQINELLEKLNDQNNIGNKNITSDDKKNENQDTNTKKDNMNTNKYKEDMEELNQTILKLNYEKKFFQDQLEILTKELENMEKLKNDYIKKLKEDLEQTEEIAARAKLSVAEISFEKETELVKYKKYCKKLKLKMQQIQLSTPVFYRDSEQSLNDFSTPEYKKNCNVNIVGPYGTVNNSAKRSLNDISLSNNLLNSEYGTHLYADNNKKGFFDKIFNK